MSKRILAALAAVLLALGALACEGDAQGPGEPQCVDDDGRRAPCPERW